MALPKLPISPGFAGFALDAGAGQISLGTSGIVANPGGGQANAVQLPSLNNRVTTVGTAGDSVVLPIATPGLTIIVTNAAALSLNVFPSGATDVINALAAATAFPIGAGKLAVFTCAVAGQWTTINTANLAA